MKWLDFEVTMKPRNFWQNPWNLYYTFVQEDDLFEASDSFLKEILRER